MKQTKQHTNLCGSPKTSYVHGVVDFHYEGQNDHKCLQALTPHNPNPDYIQENNNSLTLKRTSLFSLKELHPSFLSTLE